VFARRQNQQAEWRAALHSSAPTDEPASSAAAQRLVPIIDYTSADQQRLMSEKTDWLGLCGALGGYIQCPNKPP
jgi:hypothetical protein